jgi:hypothetical protein
MNEYKVKVLNQMLKESEFDPFYCFRLKGDTTKTINLDSDAIQILILYYKNKKELDA